MQTQTYFHTPLETDANRCNEKLSLLVNCTGVVAKPFLSGAVRKDFYYIYVVQGKMIMPEETLQSGDVMVIKPGTTYQYLSEGETVYYWVHYTGYDAAVLTETSMGKMNVKYSIGIHKEITDCFHKMFREFMIHDETAEELLPLFLREILLYTGRFMREEEKKNAPMVALEYIHQHFRQEICVNELAKMEQVGCTAFRMAFKDHTGVSPNEYMIAQRISEACHLLSQTEMSVGDIASEVGYEDPYYFSRIFKKKVGMPPLKYRRYSREKTK